MSVTCPICDSEKVERIMVTETYPVPFCGEVPIAHPTYRCLDCNEEGDFDGTLDEELTKAVDKANLNSASQLIDDLARKGITMTYFQKALRLPFRTTSRWRHGKISRSSLALLRLIEFSPALLMAADDNFTEEARTRYQLTRSLDWFVNNSSNPECVVVSNKENVHIYYTGIGSMNVKMQMEITSNIPEIKVERAPCLLKTS